MHHIIGLDAGTNSTGFAVFDQENNLLDYGVDTFPMGNEVDKNGTEISRNGQRRVYRGIRRNRFRYHLRRSHLADKILKPIGMRPDSQEVVTATWNAPCWPTNLTGYGSFSKNSIPIF